MFIAVKETKIIAIHQVEWACRQMAKGLSKSEYWAWLDSVTIKDESGFEPSYTYDFSGEDYEIIETDAPLSYESTIDGVISPISFYESGHITSSEYGSSYHLKWDGTKIVKDDTAKAAWELTEEWKQIRAERNRLLSETDWVVIKARENGGQVPAAWKTYRVALRDIPSEQSDKTKYSEITWPTRPE